MYTKEQRRQWAKKWYYKNLEKTRALNNARARKYRTTEKGKANARRGIKKHRKKIKTDPKKFAEFKYLNNLRGRVKKVMKIKYKSKRTRIGPKSVFFGCSYRDLRDHIEKQFKPGMNWSNYGQWHVDHIKPFSLFNISKRSELLKAFNYKNLQPLWAKENLKKSSKYNK